MPLPIVAGLLGGAAKRIAGKALRWATKGKLLGSGGGRAALKRVGGAVAGTAAAGVVVPYAGKTGVAMTKRVASGTTKMLGFGDAEPRQYRRMNPMNVRALRRAVRRLGSAEKLFKTVYRFNHGKAAVNVRPKTGRGR